MPHKSGISGRQSSNALGWIRRRGAAALALAIFAAASWVLVTYIQRLPLGAIEQALLRINSHQIFAALFLTFVSFSALAAYDVFAVRIVAPGRIAIWRAAFAGATGNAVSNTLGFHALTGALVRFRVYRNAGLGMKEIAQVVSLSWTSLGLGFLTMLALAMLMQPDADTAIRLGGVSLVIMLIGLLIWLSLGQRTISLLFFSLPLPSVGLAALQMLVGAIEMGAAIGALYVLLPHDLAPSFSVFAVAYISAVLLGIVSSAPGGVGVFEAAMLSVLSQAGRADFLVALLLYRAIYNLLPFGLSIAALTTYEIVVRLRSINSKVGRV